MNTTQSLTANAGKWLKMITYGITQRDLKMVRTGIVLGYTHNQAMAVLKNLYESRKRKHGAS